MEYEGSLRLYKNPPPAPVLNQINLVHALPLSSHFLKTNFTIVLLSTPESSKLSLSLRFPHQNTISET
jgi:hypothetical protein